MSQRTAILGRIREALGNDRKKTVLPAKEAVQALLPSVEGDAESLVAAFCREAEALRAEVLLCATFEEASQQLAALARTEEWNVAAFHQGPRTNRVVPGLPCDSMTVEPSYDMAALERCDVAITECEALVAANGSILVTSRTCGGRSLSVLPPHHVVIAQHRQLVPDLGAALEILEPMYAHNAPSFAGFITGPSRTGDIERILVLGAHGPRRLTVLLAEEE